eukprot:917140-Rhodomonas_salina.2
MFPRAAAKWTAVRPCQHSSVRSLFLEAKERRHPTCPSCVLTPASPSSNIRQASETEEAAHALCNSKVGTMSIFARLEGCDSRDSFLSFFIIAAHT